MPTVFIGVDVFHAPPVFDPRTKKRGRKESVGAIIVQVLTKADQNGYPELKIFSKTHKRAGGNEFDLGDAMKETVSEALRKFEVSPASVVVWRDGIAESSFRRDALDEIRGVRRGLEGKGVVGQTSKGQQPPVPLAYVVCQKRIGTKLLMPNGKQGAPAGTLVSSLQGMSSQTFYINGRSPPFSTPKPVRYIVLERNDALNQVPLGQLTWDQCHCYANWTGSVKVPAVCQYAHKLAELAGSFPDAGSSIDYHGYTNRLHFL